MKQEKLARILLMHIEQLNLFIWKYVQCNKESEIYSVNLLRKISFECEFTVFMNPKELFSKLFKILNIQLMITGCL